jgi:hypothetical protein
MPIAFQTGGPAAILFVGTATRPALAPSRLVGHPLDNGNILVASNWKFVRELNRNGGVVWEWTPGDTPDYAMSNLQLAARLPNGDTLINDWFNQWSGEVNSATAGVQAIEVTPDKKVVWALRSWSDPANLGPATTIQILPKS